MTVEASFSETLSCDDVRSRAWRAGARRALRAVRLAARSRSRRSHAKLHGRSRCSAPGSACRTCCWRMRTRPTASSLFGKRRDGTLAPPARGADAAVPVAACGASSGSRRYGLRREACWHEVSPGLYLGRRPSRERAAQGLPPGRRPDVGVHRTADVVGAYAYRCLPMLNRHVPSDAEVRALLRELARVLEAPIYVHCGAGRGRSAMIVAALLVLQRQGRRRRRGRAHAQAIRPGVHLHAAQKALITRQCAALQRGAAPQSRSPSATPKCA